MDRVGRTVVVHRAVAARAGPETGGGQAVGPGPTGLVRILFVLHFGIQWEYLPQELGFGSGMTCRRRLAAWNEAGVWDELHLVLLKEAAVGEEAGMVPGGDRLLPRAGRSARPKSGPSPVDRARPGSNHHVITDAQGIPLAVSLTGGNRNDVTQLLPLLDKIPAVAGVVGRPRHRSAALLADRGYDHDKYRRLIRQRGIRPLIAERGQEHGSGLGIFRYVVERTIAWLHGFRRLRIRWERRDDIHEAFLGIVSGSRRAHLTVTATWKPEQNQASRS
ncbi:IS5 family transposase [Streptomyces griseoloalbus]|uniref:IS5 family transposase n=1 Tax=Streptomyces griseoloalbus TaxID=67303 RepID=A0ABV3E5M4_9ACTN